MLSPLSPTDAAADDTWVLSDPDARFENRLTLDLSELEPQVALPGEIDPTLKTRIQPGDYIVAGRNFFCGQAHSNGMIAMKALGLPVLCASMPFLSFRAATGVAPPCLTQCIGIREYVRDGDEPGVDVETGEVRNIAICCFLPDAGHSLYKWLYHTTLCDKEPQSMPAPDPQLVDNIRAASRQMVRELGFMQTTLAATDYPPSSVHAILEIGAQGSLSSAQLAEVLCLEKSSISRMVHKLVDAGELKELASRDDARIKLLTLTAKGRRTLAAIQAFGRKQVSTGLASLSVAEQQTVARGMEAYARALEGHRLGRPLAPPAVELQSGYRPGVIGRVAEMHAAFYARHAGFGQFFESQVAAGMAEFAARVDRPGNGLWVAMRSGRIEGAIAIDGEDLGGGVAHLRWFIVDDSLRGAGVGRLLLARALDFCDGQGFASTRLWTFQGLEAARRLYEQSGFVLDEERTGDQWGSRVVEQRFERPRGYTPHG